MSLRTTARYLGRSGYLGCLGYLGSLGCMVLLALPLACSDSNQPGPDDSSCLQHGPAFRVQLLTADGRPIPPDTRIEVSYQGGLEESFRVGRPSKNEDVCCRLTSAVQSPLPPTSCAAADAGAFLEDLTEATAVLCDVWSNGAATLQVSAHGYEPLTAELTAEADEKCKTIVTSEVSLILEHGDAGLGGHRPR